MATFSLDTDKTRRCESNYRLENELGKEEKDALKMSLDDIISENPRSKLGVL